jgi:hypothetical protein
MSITEEKPWTFFPWKYTDSEKRFLYLIATQSGYFFHKHYAAFLGIAPNKRTAALIEKALRYGHIVQREYEHGHYKLYHLFSRRVYERLGQDNSSLRKPGSANLATTRLMVTSFIVANPNEAYFDSETAKVEYFTQKLGIPLHALPQKKFRSRTDQELVTRYFVEKFPIFIEKPGEPGSAVVFTYFETSIPSLEGFKTFLNSYKQLFLALNGNYRIIYGARTDAKFSKAEECFRSISSQQFNPAELLHYFQVRKLAEEKQFRRMTHPDLVDWQRGLKRFVGQFFEDAFRQWKQEQILPQKPVRSNMNSGNQFSTFLINF